MLTLVRKLWRLWECTWTYLTPSALFDSLVIRSEKVTQGLLAAMSIAESKSVIQQGREVQKVTELALVFIPMSFVSSLPVCGHSRLWLSH